MPVLILRIITILEPLLQLPVASCLHRRNELEVVRYLLSEDCIGVEDLRGLQGSRKRVTRYLVIHRARSGHGCVLAYGTVLGTDGRRDDKRGSLRIGVRGIVHQEPGSPFDNRVPLTQEVFVQREEIMLPQMRGQPCPAIRIHPPVGPVNRTRNPPYVGVVMSHEATTPIHHLCRAVTRDAEIADQREKRWQGGREIGHLCWPIIHLRVDVDCIFAVPWRIKLLVPNALKVCSLASRL